MKNTVVFDEYHDADLKPSDLIRRYIDLTRDDVTKILSAKDSLKSSPCPACQSKKISSSFEKFKLTYNECGHCKTLFISPRPSDEKLDDFYKNSKSAIFWREQLSLKTQAKRKEKIIKPRFQWILDSTLEYFPKARHYTDINTNQFGYIEELHKTKQFKQKTIIHPLMPKDAIRFDGEIDLVDLPWWEAKLKNPADVVSLFEVCDRTSDVEGLLKKVYSFLKTDGLCFMTNILISGFDLLVLWDKAENLYPPDRLNVFSIEGLKLLFDRHGFEILELSTPGILDADLVLKAMKDNPQIEIPRFARYLLSNRDEEVRMNFQEFLQSNLLSSYGRIVVRKK